MIKINRYRMIAHIYPHLSFEVEVEKDGQNIYLNVDVNSEHEMEYASLWRKNGEFWVYKHPLDEATENDLNGVHSYSLTDEEADTVMGQIEKKWNDNPIFVGNEGWKDWTD